jgi:pyruvate/2-oxoglutarate dehydrogenase complex dihydrolipoamide acyltransferase (E2) component
MMPTPTRRHGLAAARRIAVELTPQTVEQIASRVAQLLHHQPPTQTSPAANPGWMTAKELANHLKLNPSWVYEHAQELGAIRTGTGPKARIRFDLHTATQALKNHQPQPTPAAATAPRRKPARPAPYPTDAPLLQIRDPYPRNPRGCHARTRRRLAVS